VAWSLDCREPGVPALTLALALLRPGLARLVAAWPIGCVDGAFDLEFDEFPGREGLVATAAHQAEAR